MIATPVLGFDELCTSDACVQAIIRLANTTLKKGRWKEFVRPGGELYWLVVSRPTEPLRRDLPPGGRLRLPSLRELRSLQREVRKALQDVTKGLNLRPLLNRINRDGGYRYVIDAMPPPEEGLRVGPVRPNWQIMWVPAVPTCPRQAGLWALGQALGVARRIGRCDQCQHYFLRKKEQRQRFCSEVCSTAFHNERRLASGYFKQRRAERRKEAGKKRTGARSIRDERE